MVMTCPPFGEASSDGRNASSVMKFERVFVLKVARACDGFNTDAVEQASKEDP